MHPSASHRRLNILVSTDTDLASVRILVHGCVSPVNLHALDLVIRRAAALSPGTRVVLDLSDAQARDSLRPELCPTAIITRLAGTMSAPAGTRLQVLPPVD